MTVDDVHALPSGYDLNHYRIENVIGRGGFGITYQAKDTVLRKTVAIKEYLPVEFAVRVSDASVQPRSRRAEQDYRWGLERFLDEARTLARFRHPNLVPVLVFFEANGTAYMVMEFERGHALGEILADDVQRRRLIERLPVLLDGILLALREVHAAGFLHRDIKPANIILRPDGSPVLVDFGSARHAIGQRSRTLTSIVTPRYAPIEQYALEGRQGPWSDLYGLAAVLHHVIVGEPPPEAVSRVRDDPYRPLAARTDLALPQRMLQAIDTALAVYAEQRPQSVAAFQALVTGGTAVPLAAVGSQPDEENAPTRILAGGGARLGAPAMSEAEIAPATYSADDAGSVRIPDGQLRAVRSEDRIFRPPPRRASPWLRAGVPLTALAMAAIAVLYFSDLVQLFGRGAPAVVAVANAPQPPVPATAPSEPPTPPIVTATGPAATAGGSTPTPNPGGTSGTGPKPNPTPIKTPPVNPAANNPNPTNSAPSGPAGVTGSGSNAAPLGSPGPSGSSAGSAPSIGQIQANAEQAAAVARDQALRDHRRKASEEAVEAAKAAKANGDRATATAQQARARAGAARIRAAEAAKPDLAAVERVTYGDGSVYIGQISNGRRNGLGVVELPSGERQAGEWLDDKLQGLAVLTLPDGRRYEGEWKAQLRDGLGVVVLGDNAQVAGQHVGDAVNGFAVWGEADGRIRAGVWRDSKLEGAALETVAGERYEGEFRGGIRHGKGVLVRTDGSSHHGMFADGRRDGYGVEIRPDGRSVSGAWSQDSLVRQDQG